MPSVAAWNSINVHSSGVWAHCQCLHLSVAHSRAQLGLRNNRLSWNSAVCISSKPVCAEHLVVLTLTVREPYVLYLAAVWKIIVIPSWCHCSFLYVTVDTKSESCHNLVCNCRLSKGLAASGVSIFVKKKVKLFFLLDCGGDSFFLYPFPCSAVVLLNCFDVLTFVHIGPQNRWHKQRWTRHGHFLPLCNNEAEITEMWLLSFSAGCIIWSSNLCSSGEEAVSISCSYTFPAQLQAEFRSQSWHLNPLLQNQVTN